jgi:hypothetical protein
MDNECLKFQISNNLGVTPKGVPKEFEYVAKLIDLMVKVEKI